MRTSNVVATLALLALTMAVIAPGISAAAIPEPVGDCNEDGTVATACAPVCVQGPCYPYACEEVTGRDLCIRP